MERVTDEWLAKSIAFMQAMQGWFTDSQNNELQAMLELRDRRAQRCATCAAWEPFSDDPVFSADEDLWCAELERHKPSAGYCDCWRAKRAADGRESMCPDCNGQGWVSFGIDGASCSKCGGRGWNG